ncbi:BRCT domain-containing protein At4g02110-like isoform X1 [Salvia hispanica]|uniref:BRCT domain-containing protein At4g02110-like isoform X1 n=2 Tax=Salvia hispanica TaxID=49212 RepID=UPI002009910D|nr:BRCT domain-containing protein At4g02110-like isoform X1 [Salvia hispanica]
MLASKQISAYNDPSKVFVGIRFVLFGFDSVREDEVRAKLLEGGAVDSVNYGPDCNHVIVDNLLYDDPICAAARRDGKILVIGKWVDDCFYGGMLVDPTVMYWPVRDPSGIPAAKSLVMCLTGYLGQDRDDIKNMVALMGATFTKPLLATKVTHLICYKFEGEKYELAKKMKTIKLVNHHWLEDSLKAWQLLPEADYAKSGFEFMMEAQAKDSEEETEDMASVDLKKKSITSPHNALDENRNFQSPERQVVSRTSGYVTAFESFANVGNASKTNSTPRKVNTGKTQSISRNEADFENASLSRDTHCEDIDTSNTSCARSPAKMFHGVPSTNSENIEHVIASASGSARKSVNDGLSKLSSKSMKASLPLRSERIESISGSPLSTASKTGLCGGFDISMERDLDETDSHGIRSTLKGSFLLPNEGETVGSHRTNNPNVPRGSPRSPVLSHSPNTLIRSGLATKPTEMPVSRSSVDGSCRIPCDMSSFKGTSYLREEIADGFAMPSEIIQDGTGSTGLNTPLKGALSHLDEEQTGSLPRTKKMTISRSGSKSRRLSRSPTTRAGCLREEVGGTFVLPSENIEDGTESTEIQTPLKGALLYHDEEQPSSLSGTKKMNVPRSGLKSTKRTRSSKILMGSGLDAKPMEMLVSGSSVHGTHQAGADVTPTNVTNCMREEVGGVLNMPSEREGDTTESGGIKTPLDGVSLHPNKKQTSSLPGRKKTTVSHSKSKSTKLSRSQKTLVGTVLDTKATEILVSGTPIHGTRQSAVDISPPTNIISQLREEALLISKEALATSTPLEEKQECGDHTITYSRGRPKKRRLPDSDAKDLSASRTKSCTGEEDIHQSDPPDASPPFPGSSSMVEEPDDHTDLNSSKVDNSGTKSKSPKKKMLARKSLGSKPTSCKEKTSKYKGLLSAVLQSKSAGHLNGAVAVEHAKNASLAEKFDTVSSNRNEDVPVGDETEAPECEGPNEFDTGSKNSAEVEEHHTSKQSSKKTTQKKEAKSRVKKSTEAKKHAELPESTSRGDVAENKITEGKKRPLAKSKMDKLKGPTEEAKQDEKKTVSKKGEMVVSAGKTGKRPSKKLKGSHNVEKENEPVMQPIVSCDTGAASDSTHKSKKPLKDGSKVDKVYTKDLTTKAEPAWFILSGHRLQRKEFQQVIKRLKGKVCRDSHNWSYQATHFIVPDPIRRTEKFFAAAASGSWILKTDYLTASTEAGRLLPEEPYEWQKRCLTEDGSINLEAPRKWRLLRERTGHGAFYGMRIVIYGECIAPPLDTLKRVIKAGDGTILATSPPYTRFLNSRVDFAIVSAGMPRVDMWVQEFLRHEIPCILADYVVEYVCKPGYSLDKHVQYQTHAWAKRSLENLVNRVEAVEDHPKTPEEHRVDDTVCQVCGSRDRGNEMLICGDESGTHGCGVGTHMDCLDPPLEAVPEEEWFCRDCCHKTSSRSSKKRAKKSKK